jgi:hypothetical protein
VQLLQPIGERESGRSAELEKMIFSQPPLLLKNQLQLDFLDSTRKD